MEFNRNTVIPTKTFQKTIHNSWRMTQDTELAWWPHNKGQINNKLRPKLDPQREDADGKSKAKMNR